MDRIADEHPMICSVKAQSLASGQVKQYVGVRDILMDYVKPDGLRLALRIGVLLLLAAYVGWTIQILWR